MMTKKVKTCSPEKGSKVWGHMLETNYTGIPVSQMEENLLE